MWAETKWFKINALVFFALAGFTPRAQADVTVLLEEPYSYDGALAGTGHTAIYLNRVCAATPVTLRRCNPDEHGVVISRYTRIAGYDWVAIPLIPYLYAVEDPEDVPLYADSKLEAFLRDQYRRTHLEELAPDAPGGGVPKGDWVQLVGSSYDRTNYGFEIETTAEQDDALIAWVNSQPNRAIYQFASTNCADFVRDVLNFYFPNSVGRGSIADLFISTPKHAAKSLVKYGKHHSDLEYTHFVIPQVPGEVKRSRPVRGVLESLIRAKKYVLVLAAFHPLIGGGVVTADLIADRSNAEKNTMVFSLAGQLLAPPTKSERDAYLKELRTAIAKDAASAPTPGEITLQKFVERSHPEFDASGRLVLQAPSGKGMVELGVTRNDLQTEDAPIDLQKNLMIFRLKQTLARSRAPRISSSELLEDWQLLEKINETGQAQLSKKSIQGVQRDGPGHSAAAVLRNVED